jgi:hypothetical protein
MSRSELSVALPITTDPPNHPARASVNCSATNCAATSSAGRVQLEVLQERWHDLRSQPRVDCCGRAQAAIDGDHRRALSRPLNGCRSRLTDGLPEGSCWALGREATPVSGIRDQVARKSRIRLLTKNFVSFYMTQSVRCPNDPTGAMPDDRATCGGAEASGSGFQFALTAAEYHRTIHRRDLRCSSRSQSSSRVSREFRLDDVEPGEGRGCLGDRAAGLDLDDCGASSSS